MNFLFGFQGRIRRTSYFFGTIVVGMLKWALLAPVLLTGLYVDGHWNGDWSSVNVDWAPNVFMAVAGGIVALLAVWIGLALSVKRWHDANLSGWFALLTLVPGADFVLFLLLCLLPGTDGPNTYGSDPRRDSLIATA